MPKVYLDETGFDTFYYRPYVYALRGRVVKARISGKRYERTSLVAARADKKLIAPIVYKGTCIVCLVFASVRRFSGLRIMVIMSNYGFHQDFMGMITGLLPVSSGEAIGVFPASKIGRASCRERV